MAEATVAALATVIVSLIAALAATLRAKRAQPATDAEVAITGLGELNEALQEDNRVLRAEILVLKAEIGELRDRERQRVAHRIVAVESEIRGALDPPSD